MHTSTVDNNDIEDIKYFIYRNYEKAQYKTFRHQTVWPSV